MATEEDDFYYPPERLAELLALAETAPHPLSEDAREATPELVEALRRSVIAHIANLPTAEQAEILNSWSQEKRDEILAELPEEQRERLLTLSAP